MRHLTGEKQVRIRPGCYFGGQPAGGEVVEVVEPVADFMVNHLRSAEYVPIEEAAPIWMGIVAWLAAIVLLISWAVPI